MIHDLRISRVQMPVIPKAATIKKRMEDLRQDLRKLETLHRVAVELENGNGDASDEVPSNA